MGKKIWIWVIVIIAILAVIGSFSSDQNQPITGNVVSEEEPEPVSENSIPAPESEPILKELASTAEELFVVTRVVDGDTIEIETGERVRLICMDTPERGEEGYIGASNYLQSLILNKEVRLEKDISETDKYGRLLRYIYLDDLFINEKMVEEGFASAYPYNPDTTLCPQIQEAEAKAKANKKGIWAEEPEQEEETSEYVCSSNFYNCGDFSTHTEAQNVFEICGSGDIHQLDRDEDGIACESLP